MVIMNAKEAKALAESFDQRERIFMFIKDEAEKGKMQLVLNNCEILALNRTYFEELGYTITDDGWQLIISWE